MLSQRIAYLIGIDYQNNLFVSPLFTPIYDAEKIGDTLETNYGFDITYHITPSNTTQVELNKLLDTIRSTSFAQDSQVIFYFAGHGTIQKNEQGQINGYIIPLDATRNHSTYIAMSDIYTAFEKAVNPPHHLLIILDCCFAGTFNSGLFRDFDLGETTRQDFEFYKDKMSWQVLTSSAHNEKAIDFMTDNRGSTVTSHSPFLSVLDQILLDQVNGSNPSNYITATQLFLKIRDYFVHQYVQNGFAQTPGLSPIHEKHVGDFIFVKSSIKKIADLNLQEAPILDEDNNPYRGLKAYEEAHQDLFFGRSKITNEIIDEVVEGKKRLILVTGVSGSGKSSLIKAAVVPKLREKGWSVLPVIRISEKYVDKLNEDYKDKTLLKNLLQLIEEQKHSDYLDTLKGLSINSQRRLYKRLIKNPMLYVKHSTEQNVEHNTEQDEHRKINKIFQEKLNVIDYIKIIIEELIQNIERRELNGLETQISGNFSEKITQEKLITWIKTLKEDQQVLLVVDQFEEVSTSLEKKKLVKKFLDDLGDLCINGPSNLKVLFTIRIDFEDLLLEDYKNVLSSDRNTFLDWWTKQIPQNINKEVCSRIVVGEMGPEELREAIVGPARKNSIFFEENSTHNLIDTIIKESYGAPGALPLVSFVMSKLYQCCIGKKIDVRTITYADYVAIGRLRGSIVNSIKEIYGTEQKDKNGEPQLSIEQLIFKSLMLRMVSPNLHRIARDRIYEEELIFENDTHTKEANDIIKKLEGERLVVSGIEKRSEDHKSKKYYEPAHDEVVGGWDQIRLWIKNLEEKNFLLIKELIEDARKRQNENGGHLWTWKGRDLSQMRRITGTQKFRDKITAWFVSKTK